jgi:hypothetical protein
MDSTDYQNGDGGPATASLDESPDTKGGEDTFFLPSDFCEGMDYKEGDTITLKVVNAPDSDGDVEVKMAKGESKPKDDFYSDMRSSMSDEGGQSE